MRGLIPPWRAPAAARRAAGRTLRSVAWEERAGRATRPEESVPLLPPAWFPRQMVARTAVPITFNASLHFSSHTEARLRCLPAAPRAQGSSVPVLVRGDPANSRAAPEELKHLWLSCPQGSFPKLQSWPLAESLPPSTRCHLGRWGIFCGEQCLSLTRGPLN